MINSKQTLAARIIEILEEAKAQDITCLDVRSQTTVTDHMIICTGSSSRHVRALAQTVMTTLKAEGVIALHDSGLETGEWALIDFGDAVVHVMQKEMRAFYDLEGLWSRS